MFRPEAQVVFVRANMKACSCHVLLRLAYWLTIHTSLECMRILVKRKAGQRIVQVVRDGAATEQSAEKPMAGCQLWLTVGASQKGAQSSRKYSSVRALTICGGYHQRSRPNGGSVHYSAKGVDVDIDVN